MPAGPHVCGHVDLSAYHVVKCKYCLPYGGEGQGWPYGQRSGGREPVTDVQHGPQRPEKRQNLLAEKADVVNLEKKKI